MQQIKRLTCRASCAARECAASMQEDAWMSSSHTPALMRPQWPLRQPVLFCRAAAVIVSAIFPVKLGLAQPKSFSRNVPSLQGRANQDMATCCEMDESALFEALYLRVSPYTLDRRCSCLYGVEVLCLPMQLWCLNNHSWSKQCPAAATCCCCSLLSWYPLTRNCSWEKGLLLI